MDILWLQQNSVSRQLLANAISTLSEQLTAINNVVNGFVCTTDDSNGGGDDDDDDDGRGSTTNVVINTKSDPTTDTQINRSNETIFTKTLINSIRGNVACAHRYRFNGGSSGGGDDDNGSGADNYQYQSRRHDVQSSSSSSLPRQQHRQPQSQKYQYHEQKPQPPQSPQQRHQQQQAFPQHLSLSSSHLAWTTRTTRTTINEDIKAIGVSVNLDMKKCGTISTYDCDSNYNNTTATTAATTTKTYTFHSNYGPGIKNKFRAQHDVKNDSCNYTDNNYNNNNKSNGNDNSRNNQNNNRSTRSTPSTAMPFGMDSGNSIPSSSSGSGNGSSSSMHINNANFFERLNIDSSSFNQMPLFAHAKASIHAQPPYDKHGSPISSRNQWWKKLVIVICYLFLLSSSLRFCSANKHEGNFSYSSSPHFNSFAISFLVSASVLSKLYNGCSESRWTERTIGFLFG